MAAPRKTTPAGLTKPADLTPKAAWAWTQIVAELAVTAPLKPLDSTSLAMACETYSRWHAAVAMRNTEGLLADTSQGTSTAAWVGIEERAAAAFRTWCAEFGLSPLARGELKQSTEGAAPIVSSLTALKAKNTARAA